MLEWGLERLLDWGDVRAESDWLEPGMFELVGVSERWRTVWLTFLTVSNTRLRWLLDTTKYSIRIISSKNYKLDFTFLILSIFFCNLTVLECETNPMRHQHTSAPHTLGHPGSTPSSLSPRSRQPENPANQQVEDIKKQKKNPRLVFIIF